MTKVPDLTGWIPIRFFWEQGRPWIDWCYAGTRRFREPFFDQTVEQCLRLPFNLLFRRQTPVEVLADWQAVRPGLLPTGLLFHTSRCGSTLVSQMLAALPQNVVLSEAGPLDGALRAHLRAPGVTDEQRIAWLRGIVSALGQPRNPGEKHLFIKLDSWHTLELPLLLRAFPGVPWIFLYRDPVEVLVSHLRQRGAQMVPAVLDPASIGLDLAAAHRMVAEEYIAHVLARICETALYAQEQTGRGLLVNYSQLPAAAVAEVAAFFGMAWSAEERERMLGPAQFNAKNPSLFFAPDSAEKKQQATDRMRQAVDVRVRPAYDRLEVLRQARASVS
jgi:hypothetical protein